MHPLLDSKVVENICARPIIFSRDGVVTVRRFEMDGQLNPDENCVLRDGRAGRGPRPCVPISDLGGLTSVLGKGDAFISGGHTSSAQDDDLVLGKRRVLFPRFCLKVGYPTYNDRRNEEENLSLALYRTE